MSHFKGFSKDITTMKKIDREIRSYCGDQYQPRLREAADGQESRTIEGYAIVFGVRSQLLFDWYDRYYEVIEPGAIDEARLREMDIKMTIFHDREMLIARSNKGVGTLKLTVDEIGVKYEFDAPRTSAGETALELVKRGDLAGSSFTYWSDEKSSVRYEILDDDVLLRHVDRIDRVYEMTIAADPAYTETTVTAREVEAAGIKLPGKQDDEAAEAAKPEESAKADAPKAAEDPTAELSAKYAAKDNRVRLGAYHIVGTDKVIKAKEGQTLGKISRTYLGPDMECYMEVYNDMKASDVLKAGQEVKIPKLVWKRAARAKSAK